MKENYELISFFLNKTRMPAIPYINNSSFLDNFSLHFFSKKTSENSENYSNFDLKKNSINSENGTNLSNNHDDLANVFRDIKESKKRRSSVLRFNFAKYFK